MRPWPELPCHWEQAPGHVFTYDPGPSAVQLRTESGAAPLWLIYFESTGYRWATAMWDRLTGRWYAKCNLGHVVRGRT